MASGKSPSEEAFSRTSMGDINSSFGVDLVPTSGGEKGESNCFSSYEHYVPEEKISLDVIREVEAITVEQTPLKVDFVSLEREKVVP